MFNIGEFARHARVSIRMLRHYDAIGLLPPAATDNATGYRLYEGRQLPRLNRILALKNLGFTLEEVGSILDQTVGLQELRGMMRLREVELRSQIRSDTGRLAQVEARLQIIEKEGTMPEKDIQIKRVPAVRVAELIGAAASFEPESISPVISPLYDRLIQQLSSSGVSPVGPGIAYYEISLDGKQVIVHAGLPVSVEPDQRFGFAIVDLPEIEQAATIVHCGSMDDVMPTVQALACWIEANGYHSSGLNRELYLETVGPRGGWVTELQEPIVVG